MDAVVGLVLAGERRRKESWLARTDGRRRRSENRKALVVLAGERRRKEFRLARTDGRRRRPDALRRKEKEGIPARSH
jgi:hypothetical protein